jgi:HD-GYP domain-containing protein (c-di-GMP phosphodiesterase class II)
VTGQILFFSASTYLLISTLKQLNKHLYMHRKEVQYRSRAEKKIRQLNQELIKSYEITLRGWSRALELKDKETQGHSQRVVNLSRELGIAYGLPKSLLVQLEYGAMLHDIGKMGTPDAILHKEGPLDNQEKYIIQQHPQLAYDLLQEVSYLKDALVIPLYHHERWNGSGYPSGLIGEDIPLLARIFSIADVWDALTSERPYSPRWEPEDALEYMKKNKAVLFDPYLMDLFFGIIENYRLLTQMESDRVLQC